MGRKRRQVQTAPYRGQYERGHHISDKTYEMSQSVIVIEYLILKID